MSEQTAQEPTMEEILASIRRIISEDEAPPSEDAAPGDPPHPAIPADAPEPEPAEPAVAAAPEPEPEPEAPAPVEDVLELTDRVETVGDIEAYSPEPEPAPPAPAAPPPEPAPVAAAPAPSAETLLAPAAASAAASAFGKLSQVVHMPKEGRTLEDVTAELLRPLLKQWLDENLPRIVQEAVDQEVARLTRGRVG